MPRRVHRNQTLTDIHAQQLYLTFVFLAFCFATVRVIRLPVTHARCALKWDKDSNPGILVTGPPVTQNSPFLPWWLAILIVCLRSAVIQSWPWVGFLQPNPTQPMTLLTLTQLNPPVIKSRKNGNGCWIIATGMHLLYGFEPNVQCSFYSSH